MAGAPLAAARLGHTTPAATGPEPSGDGRIPPDTLPGGAYDRYVAELAAEGKFSGVVLLSHRGRTVLSRSYGMADKEKGIPNSEGVAFNLSSGSQPFGAVAILQLAQQGKVKLSDTVGTHLTGYARDIAAQVTIHQMLTSTSGLSDSEIDPRRIFHSREEVHEFLQQWTRQAKLVAVPARASTPTPTARPRAEPCSLALACGPTVAFSAVIVGVASTTASRSASSPGCRRGGTVGSRSGSTRLASPASQFCVIGSGIAVPAGRPWFGNTIA